MTTITKKIPDGGSANIPSSKSGINAMRLLTTINRSKLGATYSNTNGGRILRLLWDRFNSVRLGRCPTNLLLMLLTFMLLLSLSPPRILVGEEDEISFVDRFKYFITLLIYESI